MRKIPLFWPNIYKDEWLIELSKVFDTRWLGEGPKTKEFEKEFEKKFNYKHCLSTNSGTSALELAYHLIGIKKGDKVITTVLTCSATNLPLVRMGANVLFADIERDDLTISFDSIKEIYKYNKDIKAIVVVNLSGEQCNIGIFNWAKKKKIPVVVDACQSLGIIDYHGDYIVYSFQAIKHFCCGDGGMLVLNKKKDYDRAKRLRWFGIDREEKIKNDWKCLNSNREICMDMEEAGYKFHMNDVAATMGLVGLERSDESLYARIVTTLAYTVKIDNRVQKIAGGSHWLYCILVNDRENFADRLRKRGVECDPVHLRNDIFTVFKDNKRTLPNMDWIEPRYLYLPMHNNLSKEDVQYVIDVVNEELREENIIKK